MLDITQVTNLKSILAQHGLTPQKKLGQHFLIDKRVLQRLLDAGDISFSDWVVDVGAGIGTITIELAKRAKKVYAVEIDKNLIPILESQICDFKNAEPCTVAADAASGARVNVVNADILNFNPAAYALRPGAYKVIGAIPYQITSPLLHHLLTQENRPSLIVIIIQKEVAEKIVACPPKATYLSNFAGIFGEAKIIGKPISPSSFWPQPDIQSAILKITQKPQTNYNRISTEFLLNYSKFLHHGFSRPRKMLNKVFDVKLLTAAGITPTRRAQTLTKDEWLKLFEISS